uniref:MIP18 family-like domain-containing protein n=1 Tax=Polytomella parva TaxID=51329 RepID=A0A7S0VNL1_9CHLO|mmetsp:Transcript_9299/g.17418  ORF Transcript_9299/g.17418 Transcript_9299/m.17418 type:complete len:204 (+) Transcript_9299:157-768(+)|eukprot:CAMPEP_0175039158 /NCGR_PEP_ID=MMETSP0052_2-20121109/370_1 /TAXON_ID=51329 ORGANISM="Polytomella parva, Strain SAG 63-3" /NCGR_SAMPLE_ID=MMETSP0052_2 /ASSEMBLY_ACC=CAM_ASM_000194 /LENGTH=203 /DNA_ID=CAMNT_0016300863 /DNA_START=117 /DNA_END=728 /DNA_ORIENTATION=-
MQLLNPNPTVYSRGEDVIRAARDNSKLDGSYDALDIYELLRDITDPEHPYTLEQLKVVSLELIKVDNEKKRISLFFTPTVPHCSMATLIGLSIRVKLQQSIPQSYKIDINVEPGSHSSEAAVNKQLGDKERIAAALENPNLRDMVEHCLTAAEKAAALEKLEKAAAADEMTNAPSDDTVNVALAKDDQASVNNMDIDSEPEKK